MQLKEFNHRFNIEILEKTSEILLALQSSLKLRTNTAVAITIGKILDATKIVFKERKIDFNGFARKHGLKQREVDKYIRIASTQGIENYDLNRVNFIISALERSDYPGTMSEFIEAYELDLDNSQPFKDFKLDVATGIQKYKRQC